MNHISITSSTQALSAPNATASKTLAGHFSDLRVDETKSDGSQMEELAEALKDKWSPNNTHQQSDEGMGNAAGSDLRIG